jgi:hypothetical protein
MMTKPRATLAHVTSQVLQEVVINRLITIPPLPHHLLLSLSLLTPLNFYHPMPATIRSFFASTRKTFLTKKYDQHRRASVTPTNSTSINQSDKPKRRHSLSLSSPSAEQPEQDGYDVMVAPDMNIPSSSPEDARGVYR